MEIERVKYTYAYRYYPKGHNHIYGGIKTRDDVERCFNYVKNTISYFSKFSGGDLVRSDTEDMERGIANIEIAINKMIAIPSLFGCSKEDIELLKEEYEELVKKVHEIDFRRVCWD